MKQKAKADKKNIDAKKPIEGSDKFITAFSDASWSSQNNHFGVGVWIRSSNGIYEHGFGGECKSSHIAEKMGLEYIVSYLSKKEITDKIIVIQCDNLGALNQLDTKILYLNGASFVKLKHVKAHTGLSTNRSKVNDWCDRRALAERLKITAMEIKNEYI